MTEQEISDRDNLEWLVYFCLKQEAPCITMSRGRELLNYTTMERMRQWYECYDLLGEQNEEKVV